MEEPTHPYILQTYIYTLKYISIDLFLMAKVNKSLPLSNPFKVNSVWSILHCSCIVLKYIRGHNSGSKGLDQKQKP